MANSNKVTYLRDLPYAMEALEAIAEAEVQKSELEGSEAVYKRLLRKTSTIAKDISFCTLIGTGLGYLATGDAEGAQQGALTGLAASAPLRIFLLSIAVPAENYIKQANTENARESGQSLHQYYVVKEKKELVIKINRICLANL